MVQIEDRAVVLQNSQRGLNADASVGGGFDHRPCRLRW